MHHIQGCDRNQTLLLPNSVDDYIGPDNPVRFVEAFVEQFQGPFRGRMFRRRARPRELGDVRAEKQTPTAPGILPENRPKRPLRCRLGPPPCGSGKKYKKCCGA